MPYATQQDLIDRFGADELAQVTDRESGAAIDAVAVQRALNDAAALADSWLAVRYRLPLAAVPAVLTGAACDLARYRLHGSSPPEIVAERNRQAIAWLGAVAAGRAALDAAGTEPAPATGGVAAEGAARLFSRDSLRGF